MQMRPLLALLIALLLTGCVGDKAEYVHSVWATPGAADRERTVYFATDRAADKDWQGGFGKHWADNLTCGSVVAVVPPDQIKDEPTGHLKQGAAAAMPCGGDAAQFARAIAAEAHARDCNEVLLYVHGFNTLFEGAALRAGQLALDTRSDCIAAVFSWSSEGEIGRYVADIEHSAYAAPELEAFLRALAAQGVRVDIVAHSIGTRVTLTALSSMARHANPPRAAFVNEMILAAGDIGADPVNNDFAHLLADARPFAQAHDGLCVEPGRGAGGVGGGAWRRAALGTQASRRSGARDPRCRRGDRRQRRAGGAARPFLFRHVARSGERHRRRLARRFHRQPHAAARDARLRTAERRERVRSNVAALCADRGAGPAAGIVDARGAAPGAAAAAHRACPAHVRRMTSTSPGCAMSKVVARPTNSPCSTTPGIADSAAASAAASLIAPYAQS